MARIRLSDTDLIKTLTAYNKSYYTVADLEKILGLSRESLYVTLNRLTTAGVLEHLAKNTYILFSQASDVERIAVETYYPSYLSFEKALSVYGILSQIPYVLTFATTRPSKNSTIGSTAVQYTHLKEELFFGYETIDGKNIALPEKALLDQLYLASRGKRSLSLGELDLRKVSKRRLLSFAKKFPRYIDRLVADVLPFVGTSPITNELQGRVEWKTG